MAIRDPGVTPDPEALEQEENVIVSKVQRSLVEESDYSNRQSNQE